MIDLEKINLNLKKHRFKHLNPEPEKLKEPAELNDNSLMPFGKHKDERMIDVPAGYFHYLWHNGIKNQPENPVREYIEDNLGAIKQENPDLIWD